MNDADAFDRIVGKAAALLYVYVGVRSVYTKTIAKQAVEIFEQYHIPYRADLVVDKIFNRQKTDVCPMEKKVLNIDSAKKAYEILKEKNR